MELPADDCTDGILVARSPGQTRIGLIAAGRLVELAIERIGQTSLTGSILRGRVRSVEPRLQGNFLDLGHLGIGFLGFEAGGKGLGIGDTLLVQVTRDAVGDKKAGLSRQITVTGRWLIFGGATGISVSRQIASDGERRRLRRVVGGLTQPDEAWMVLPSAAGADEEDLRADMARLRHRAARLSPNGAPGQIEDNEDSGLARLVDWAHAELQGIWFDDSATKSRARDLIADQRPDLLPLLRDHRAQQPLFERWEEEIEAALAREIKLPCGGRLVFDRLEALVAIDVDRGSADDLGVLGTQAMAEIALQIRLRGLAGIIIVDFPRLRSGAERTALLDQLGTNLKRDPARPQLLGWTRGGLIELTRPHGRPPLADLFVGACGACAGSGYEASPMAGLLDALRRAVAGIADRPGAQPVLRIARDLDALVRDGLEPALDEAERALGKRPDIEIDPAFPARHIEIEWRHRAGR